MSDIFDEIRTTEKLIKRQREVLYSLQEHGDPAQEYMVREKLITIKALECYLDSLEHVVNARSRDKIHSYIGEKANSRKGD